MQELIVSLAQQARQAPDGSGVAVLYKPEGADAYFSPHSPMDAPAQSNEIDVPQLPSVPDGPYRVRRDGEPLVCVTVLPFRDAERCYIRADRFDDGDFSPVRLQPFDPADPDRSLPEEFQEHHRDHLADVVLATPQRAEVDEGGFDFQALRDAFYFCSEMVCVQGDGELEYLSDAVFVEMDEYHAYAETMQDTIDDHDPSYYRLPSVDPEILHQTPADFEGPIEYGIPEEEYEPSPPSPHASSEVLPTLNELSAHFTDDPASFVAGFDAAGEPVLFRIEEPFLPELTVPGLALRDDPALVGLANLLCAQALVKGHTVVDRTVDNALRHCYGSTGPNPVETPPDQTDGLVFVVSDRENRRLHNPGTISLALGADNEQQNGRLMFYEMQVRPSDRSSAYRYECADPNDGAVQPGQRRGLVLPPMPATT